MKNNKIIIKLGKNVNIIINNFEFIKSLTKGKQTVFTFAISNLTTPEKYNNHYVLSYYMWLECVAYINGRKYSDGEITGLEYKRNQKLYLTICFYS